MNIFSVIVLAALLGQYSLDLAADLLNLKALQPEPPAPLVGVYQPEDYRRSQEYTRVNTRFGLIAGAFGLAVLVAFWFSGGFNLADRLVRSLGLAPVPSGLLYVGMLGLAYMVLTLPFSIYATFVIEQRFGFNRTTPRLFAADHAKALALGIVLGAPLLAGVLALFQYIGAAAWVLCWAGTTLYSFLVQFVAPVWIMPLFNRFTPLEPGALRDAIQKYAGSVGFEFKDIFVVDSSRRSTRSNAFFTGFGRHKRIALFDTLVQKHTVSELVAVLAHEVGHHRKHHVPLGLAIGVLHTGVVFFLLSLLLDNLGLYRAFFMEQQPVYAGLLFFGLLYAPLATLLSLGAQMLSRHNEYQADEFAADTTGDPRALADALRKLTSHNLSNLSPHPFYAFLNYSHPTLLQRIRALQKAGHPTAR